LQIKTKIVSCHTANSKPVKQEVNGTVILPPFSMPWLRILFIMLRQNPFRWFLLAKVSLRQALNAAVKPGNTQCSSKLPELKISSFSSTKWTTRQSTGTRKGTTNSYQNVMNPYCCT